MSDAGVHLTLHPDRCDQCGRCVPACTADALRVGPAYIAVDWKRCTRCFACVAECKRQAIQATSLSGRDGAASGVVDTSKVVVGSRAEAKAVRKAAEKAAKTCGKVIPFKGKPAPGIGPTSPSTPTPAAVAWVAPQASSAPAVPIVPSARESVRATPQRKQAVRVEGGARVSGTYQPGTAVWSVADLLVVLGVLLVTVVAKDAVLGLGAVGLMPSAGRTALRAGVLAVYYCLQLAAFAWLAGRHGVTLGAAFGLGSRTDADSGSRSQDTPPSVVTSVGLVVLLFAGTELFALAYGLATRAMGLSQPVRLSSDLAEVFGTGGVGLALSIVLVALVAPLVEEMAFRGVTLFVAGKRWGMWPAIIISASVYAAYHFSLWLFAPTFVLGVALGWIAWTRRSLWPAIALHVLYNASAVTAAYFLAQLR